METIDGVHHINVYSKSKTEIGRWLSNFSYSPIQTKDGDFESIEGIEMRVNQLKEYYKIKK